MKNKMSLLASLIFSCCFSLYCQNVDSYKDVVDTISVSTFDSEINLIYRTMNYKLVKLPLSVDSVTIAYGLFYSRELYSCADEFWKGHVAVPTKECEKAKRWEEERLSEKEVRNIEEFLRSDKTYKNTQSVLGGVDIFLYYYINEEIVYRIAISSITRDIVFTQDEWVINNSINKDFENYLTKLLHDKNIWSSHERFADFD